MKLTIKEFKQLIPLDEVLTVFKSTFGRSRGLDEFERLQMHIEVHKVSTRYNCISPQALTTYLLKINI